MNFAIAIYGTLFYGDLAVSYFSNRDILSECGFLGDPGSGGPPWLDLRGNHDAFGVPSDDSEENMFRKYSAQVRGRTRTNFVQ